MVTTALIDETEVERTQRWMNESMMVEDLALSDIADILFNVDGSNEENADSDVNPNPTGGDNDNMNVVLDPLDIGRGGEIEGTGDENSDVQNNIADEDVEQDFTVGPKKRTAVNKVRWAAVNKHLDSLMSNVKVSKCSKERNSLCDITGRRTELKGCESSRKAFMKTWKIMLDRVLWWKRLLGD
jgi:hypothetical protein